MIRVLLSYPGYPQIYSLPASASGVAGIPSMHPWAQRNCDLCRGWKVLLQLWSRIEVSLRMGTGILKESPKSFGCLEDTAISHSLPSLGAGHQVSPDVSGLHTSTFLLLFPLLGGSPASAPILFYFL